MLCIPGRHSYTLTAHNIVPPPNATSSMPSLNMLLHRSVSITLSRPSVKHSHTWYHQTPGANCSLDQLTIRSSASSMLSTSFSTEPLEASRTMTAMISLYFFCQSKFIIAYLYAPYLAEPQTSKQNTRPTSLNGSYKHHIFATLTNEPWTIFLRTSLAATTHASYIETNPLDSLPRV